MNLTRTTLPLGLLALAVATIATVTPPLAHARGGSDNKSDVTLVSTGVEGDASGRAKLGVRRASPSPTLRAAAPRPRWHSETISSAV